MDQALVYRLTPDILRLQELCPSLGPITVYVDSPGGRVDVAAKVLRLLHGPAGSERPKFYLITVVTSLAASAAAGLLAAGDYALAYPDSVIHFHGVRMYREDAITVEKASDAAKDLKASNDVAAIELARRCSRRFFFRFVTLRSEFARYREDFPEATDPECFVGVIESRLSPNGRSLIKRAETRTKRYDRLQDSMLKQRSFVRQIEAIVKQQNSSHPGEAIRLSYLGLEAEMLRAIISFELKGGRKEGPSWTFASQGLAQVADDFSLINEFYGQHKNDWIEEFCDQWKDFLLEAADHEAIGRLPENERKPEVHRRLSPVLLPMWLFLGSICHALQEAENPLTAIDAFWLGLIDEVVGLDLPTIRKLMERAPESRLRHT